MQENTGELFRPSLTAGRPPVPIGQRLARLTDARATLTGPVSLITRLDPAGAAHGRLGRYGSHCSVVEERCDV